jgi:hypothetical protein
MTFVHIFGNLFYINDIFLLFNLLKKPPTIFCPYPPEYKAILGQWGESLGQFFCRFRYTYSLIDHYKQRVYRR